MIFLPNCVIMLGAILTGCTSLPNEEVGIGKRETIGKQDSEQTSPYVEILRGRDGRDGRDGEPGPRGLPGVMGENGETGPQGLPGPRSGGVTYVRWGRTTCPDTEGTELVYKGRAAGSGHTESAGGSNYQCIVEDPENFDFGPGLASMAYIYGSEYQMFGNIPSSWLQYHDNDVPCSVCYIAPRETVLMIPGKFTCPPNWTREYYGFLMTERSGHSAHKGRTTYECVDKSPETVPGGSADRNGALFHHVEPRCGSLPCPPYDPQKEMTCAVCSR